MNSTAEPTTAMLDIETQEALQEFFGKVIDPKRFNNYMRKLMHASVMMALDDESSDWSRDNIKDGYYWLSELLEVLETENSSIKN